MPTYLLNYDLVKENNHSRLWAELEKRGARRILPSTWSLELATTSTAEVHHLVDQFVDTNDRVLVVKYSDWASWNALVEPH
jgi:CRISPR/Cas system-associated endoribonuclease Cas2